MKVIKTETESVLIKAGQVEAWMDVVVEHGDVVCDWNKMTYYLDNANDMRQKAWENKPGNFEDASSLAIAALEKQGYIYQDGDGVWHSRVDTLFGDSPTIHLGQDSGRRNADFQKIDVRIPRNHLPMLLRKHFGWRKDVTLKRLYRQGTVDYDEFISFCKTKGY
jgi:hypothetical protein